MAGKDEFRAWIGRSKENEDIIRAQPARFLAAALDIENTSFFGGQHVPPLWHWLYFLSAEPRSRLGRDGHPKTGGFLPPMTLPRRMWAGGRFEFHKPFLIGSQAKRSSTIDDIVMKQGRSGQLCFVTVRHDIFVSGELCLSEAQDLVYREDPGPDEPRRAAIHAPSDAEISESFMPDPVLMFRFSALTLNGHRIHYDRDYARNVEHYPDLVFHGPLTALLLAGLASRLARTRQMQRFSFRAVSPLFVNNAFTLNARKSASGFELWAADCNGILAMTATADLS
jgi:3-methylfumaryl-CoA hydratase